MFPKNTAVETMHQGPPRKFAQHLMLVCAGAMIASTACADNGADARYEALTNDFI